LSFHIIFYSAIFFCFFFFLLSPRPPSSTLFPYTTLFRSLSTTSSGRPCCARPVPLKCTASGTGGFHRGTSCSFSCWTMSLGEIRSEEHTSELQSRSDLVCRLLLEKKKKKQHTSYILQIHK